MFGEGDDFNNRDFRRAVWHQTITPVAMVTAAAGDKTDVMACEWVMMVSHSPLCFAISVHPSHLTYDLVEASGEFGLSFCTDAQAKLSHISGSYSQHEVDKWTMADFATYAATKIAAPMIANCALNVECKVVAKQALGHTVFFGEAVWARYDDEGGKPLLYHDAKYWSVGAQVPKS